MDSSALKDTVQNLSGQGASDTAEQLTWLSALGHDGYGWLLAGVILVLAEAMGLSGLGLFFAGLGALCTGTALHQHWIMADDMSRQYVVFFISAIACAAALWKPFKKLHAGKKSSEYRNILGETAYVGSNGLHKKTGGEVTWSGTVMKAQLAKGVVADALEAGSQVTIVEITGATLIVKPKE